MTPYAGKLALVTGAGDGIGAGMEAYHTLLKSSIVEI